MALNIIPHEIYLLPSLTRWPSVPMSAKPTFTSMPRGLSNTVHAQYLPLRYPRTHASSAAGAQQGHGHPIVADGCSWAETSAHTRSCPFNDARPCVLWPVCSDSLCVCSLPVFHKTVPKKWDTAQKRFKKPKKLKAEASSQHSAESQSPTSKVYCSFCTHSTPCVKPPSCVDVSRIAVNPVMHHTIAAAHTVVALGDVRSGAAAAALSLPLTQLLAPAAQTHQHGDCRRRRIRND
jgi:hypothetical protein